jgi:hypothetical protein
MPRSEGEVEEERTAQGLVGQIQNLFAVVLDAELAECRDADHSRCSRLFGDRPCAQLSFA